MNTGKAKLSTHYGELVPFPREGPRSGDLTAPGACKSSLSKSVETFGLSRRKTGYSPMKAVVPDTRSGLRII